MICVERERAMFMCSYSKCVCVCMSNYPTPNKKRLCISMFYTFYVCTILDGRQHQNIQVRNILPATSTQHGYVVVWPCSVRVVISFVPSCTRLRDWVPFVYTHTYCIHMCVFVRVRAYIHVYCLCLGIHMYEYVLAHRLLFDLTSLKLQRLFPHLRTGWFVCDLFVKTMGVLVQFALGVFACLRLPPSLGLPQGLPSFPVIYSQLSGYTLW